jgi:hypothetical protein
VDPHVANIGAKIAASSWAKTLSTVETPADLLDLLEEHHSKFFPNYDILGYVAAEASPSKALTNTPEDFNKKGIQGLGESLAALYKVS